MDNPIGAGWLVIAIDDLVETDAYRGRRKLRYYLQRHGKAPSA